MGASELTKDIMIETKTKKEHFLETLNNHNIKTLKTDSSIRDYVLFIERTKEAASKITIPCDFKDGMCENNRRNNRASLSYDCKNGCCGDCASKVGFWREIPEHYIGAMSEKWDDEKGFLGKDGCKLENRHRSGTCVGYMCWTMEPRISSSDRSILNVLKSFGGI